MKRSVIALIVLLVAVSAKAQDTLRLPTVVEAPSVIVGTKFDGEEGPELRACSWGGRDFKDGDVIATINGQRVTSKAELSSSIDAIRDASKTSDRPVEVSVEFVTGGDLVTATLRFAPEKQPNPGMSPQALAAFAFGIVFIVTLIVLAIRFPQPTPFQYNVFRIILALAGAGVAAMIPGFIDLELNPNVGLLIRAGGALAVFVILFFFNPAKLAATTPPDAYNFSVPEGWNFKQTVDALAEQDNSVAEYVDFTDEELAAVVQPRQLDTKTMTEVLLSLRSLTQTDSIRPYGVEKEGHKYRLYIKK